MSAREKSERESERCKQYGKCCSVNKSSSARTAHVVCTSYLDKVPNGLQKKTATEYQPYGA